ncbi:MAG: hypothetical protein ABW174_04935 [Flavitalea sp.]
MNKITISLIFQLILFKLAFSQDPWKQRFGFWINTELKKELEKGNAGFKIIPRMVWLSNFKTIDLEQRFEQKSTHKIVRIERDKIFTKYYSFEIKGDTMYFNWINDDAIIKFVKKSPLKN